MISLRPYQKTVKKHLVAQFANGHQNVLAVMPTGAGKTVLFSDIAMRMFKSEKTVWILVHRAELVKQVSNTLNLFGVQHACLQGSKYRPDYHARVQVISIQSLNSRLHKFNKMPDLVIVDEAHHAVSGTWSKTISKINAPTLLGVTATPVRADGVGLGRDFGGIFDEIVIGPQVSELIELGYLVQPKIYQSQHVIDMSAVKFRGGDIDVTEQAKLLDTNTITGDAVAHYKRVADGMLAVAFCVNVAHAEHVAAAFNAAGIPAMAASGNMSDTDRDWMFGQNGAFERGEIQVVTSCDLISEGFDIPKIGCAILLRRTMSEGLYLQQVGRALRPSEGKEFAIVLDHVHNTYLHHDPPHWDREWGLQGTPKRSKKTKREEIRVFQCERCWYVADVPGPCPECGHQKAAKPIKFKDGELVEVDESKMERAPKQKIRRVSPVIGEMVAEIKAAPTIEAKREIFRVAVDASKTASDLYELADAVELRSKKIEGEKSSPRQKWVLKTMRRKNIKFGGKND